MLDTDADRADLELRLIGLLLKDVADRRTRRFTSLIEESNPPNRSRQTLSDDSAVYRMVSLSARR